MLSGSFHRQLGEVSDPTQSPSSAHRPLLPGSPPGGGGSNNSSSNRVRGAGARSSMVRRTDGQTDQGPSTGPRCRGNLNDPSGPSLFAPPRPVPGTPAPEEEVGGRRRRSREGREAATPPSLAAALPLSVGENWRQVFPGLVHPSCFLLTILLWGDPPPLAADLRAGTGSPWQRYPNT